MTDEHVCSMLQRADAARDNPFIRRVTEQLNALCAALILEAAG